MSTYSEIRENGSKRFSAGDLTGAIKFYSEGISRIGPDPVFLSNRAQCWIKLGEWKNALKDTELALKQKCEPSIRVKLLFRQGVTLCAQGFDAEAERCFQQVLELDPGNKMAIEALEQPQSKKLKVLKEVIVPVEVVEELPHEYQKIIKASQLSDTNC